MTDFLKRTIVQSLKVCLCSNVSVHLWIWFKIASNMLKILSLLDKNNGEDALLVKASSLLLWLSEVHVILSRGLGKAMSHHTHCKMIRLESVHTNSCLGFSSCCQPDYKWQELLMQTIFYIQSRLQSVLSAGCSSHNLFFSSPQHSISCISFDWSKGDIH